MLLKPPLMHVTHIAVVKELFLMHHWKHMAVVPDCYIATVGDDGETVNRLGTCRGNISQG